MEATTTDFLKYLVVLQKKAACNNENPKQVGKNTIDQGKKK